MSATTNWYRWTQPSCLGCFAEHNPGRDPARLPKPEPETCCYCGESEASGIYVRVDPASVPHPTLRKD